MLKRVLQWFRTRWQYYRETLRLELAPPVPSRLSRSGVVNAAAFGKVTTVPVVMCVWDRIENLERTVEQLEHQVGCLPHLHLWNNNWEARNSIERVIIDARIPISVIHSHKNVGGFGRFYVARELASTRSMDPVIFIDDDQILSNDTLYTLIDEFRSDTVTGVWAFRFLSTTNYWERTQVPAGGAADYVGTGGMIAPLRLFLEPKLFECPRRFWFVEDLWLSYVASTVGLRLRGSGATIGFDPDEKNQFHRLTFRKTRFFRYLTRTGGWSLLGHE